jgi:hypothetical protein
MIFKELECKIRQATQLVNSLPEGSDERQTEKFRLDSYLSLYRWIKEDYAHTWAKRKGTAERVFAGLRMGYAEAAKHFDTTSDSIKASIFQSSQRIKKIIGFDIIKRIADAGTGFDGEMQMLNVLSIFRLRLEGKAAIKDIFSQDLIDDWFPDADKWVWRKMNLEKALANMEVLRSVTKIRKGLTVHDNCDPEILSSILYVLSYSCADPKIVALQSHFYTFLHSTMTLDELRENLKNIK